MRQYGPKKTDSGIKKWGKDGIVVTQRHADERVELMASCCSKKERKGRIHCGPRVYIHIEGEVCFSKMEGNWNWCKRWSDGPAPFKTTDWNSVEQLSEMYVKSFLPEEILLPV